MAAPEAALPGAGAPRPRPPTRPRRLLPTPSYFERTYEYIYIYICMNIYIYTVYIYIYVYDWLSKLWFPVGSPKYYTRCRTIQRTQKGTIVLTTIHMYVHVHSDIHICIEKCVCVCIYIYIYTCICISGAVAGLMAPTRLADGPEQTLTVLIGLALKLPQELSYFEVLLRLQGFAGGLDVVKGCCKGITEFSEGFQPRASDYLGGVP